MIYENVELHNCAEITEGDGYVALQRVPESVREKLNPGAQEKMLQPASGEIRFVLEPGESAKVTLSSRSEVGVVPFFGDHRFSAGVSVREAPHTIELTWNERLLQSLDGLRKHPHRFDPCVVRLLSRGDQVRFHKAEGKGIRPPNRDELPRVRYLSYGTSITHGAAALAAHLTYTAQTARRIGADLLNFGVGGACQCEPELADYFASRDDWHIATLALSVNMMAFTPEEFEKRVRYMVHTVAGSNPARPVVCITLYRYFGDLAVCDENHNPDKAARFRQILRDAVKNCPTPNAHIVEGPDILKTYGGLTCDIIHPADDGMIEMGENLAQVLKPLVPGAG